MRTRGLPVRWIERLTGKDAEALYREWHSFWIGWAEMICLRIPPRFPMTDHARLEMKSEEHYYHMGRAIGIMCWVVVLAVLI